jgi:Tfp pilus assembly protein PilO
MHDARANEQREMNWLRNKFSRTWRIDAAGIAACAALTFAAYLAGAEPLLDRRQQVVECSEQLNQARQQHRNLLGSNREMKSKLSGVEQALEKAEVSLQPARLVNQRIAALTALANEVGLEVQSINTSVLIPGLRFSQLPIRVISTGDYRTSAAFLHRLPQAFRDMSVAGFDLSDNPTYPKAAGFSVQLIWYVKPAAESK